MNREQTIKKLEQMHQMHLLNELNESSETFLKQVENISWTTYLKQKELLKKQPKASLKDVQPLSSLTSYEEVNTASIGKKLLGHGKVGCIIVAGGQGTRLGFNGPKGMYPLSVINKKTLFEMFAEKALAASRQVNHSLPLAIMTSPLNHKSIVSYFKENSYFGLKEEQVSFFMQGTLPFFNEKGDLFLDTPQQIAKGPNGNGYALKHFVKSGIWNTWHKKGIEYVNFVLIDNILADPFDATLIGFHHERQADIVIKTIKTIDAHEKVGLLVEKKDKIEVIEYSELPHANCYKKNISANISLFSFTIDFIKKVSQKNLPLHLAYKKHKHNGGDMMVWKFEYFIFDLLKFADKIEVLRYPREICFAPLKNAKGENSPKTVQQALDKLDRIVFKKICGQDLPKQPVELSQEFYYPTEEFIQKCKTGSVIDNPQYVTL